MSNRKWQRVCEDCRNPFQARQRATLRCDSCALKRKRETARLYREAERDQLYHARGLIAGLANAQENNRLTQWASPIDWTATAKRVGCL